MQLFRLQIVTNKFYSDKSNENSIKAEVLSPPRGIFYDRNMHILVGNKPAYTLEITPAYFDSSLAPLVEKAIGENEGYISSVLDRTKKIPSFLPRKIKRDINFKALALLEENHEHFDGTKYVIELKRDYSFGINGAHLFGYTKEIDPELLRERKDQYQIGDYIGYGGIEKNYEYLVKGTKGYLYYLVDSRQRIISRYENGKKDIQPDRGYDLVLTIDKSVQKVAELAFEGKKGALVAIEPLTGEILALVSAPAFDLQEFATTTSSEFLNSLNSNVDKPMFNRATMSRNPPGSTFKMLLAITALEEGIITTKYTVTCGGSFQFGNRPFKCTHVHGSVNVTRAIEKSCNVFFYNLMLKVGLDKWSEYGSRFGFGEKTGIDISEESNGIMPSRNYFDRVYGKGKWTDGYLISLAIGQGEVVTTPVQLAQYAALLANEGKTKIPHVLKGYIDNQNNSFVPIEFGDFTVDISKETFNIIREGMRLVVEGEGTAAHIRQKKFDIAGKTGTAQNPHGENHALFIGFAPFNNPQIAVAVIVENAGYGSTHAAPIARDVMKEYLKNITTNKSELIAKNAGGIIN